MIEGVKLNNNLNLNTCSEEEKEYIHNKLIEYNAKYITDYEDISFCYKNESNEIVGGIAGSRDNECITIDYFWIDEEFRGKGIGSKLLEKLELIAKEKKSKVINLSTFDFQAPEFYKKQGYELFGKLDNCINGHSQYFFRKIIK